MYSIAYPNLIAHLLFPLIMTGVFYNKELAAQIGMTEAPKTLAELDALMAKAKEAALAQARNSALAELEGVAAEAP